MSKSFLLLFLVLIGLNLIAQYPPPVGQEGSTAIHADSSIFIEWANNCETNRGFLDISIPDSGFVTTGESSFATGKADNLIVSLGDGGSAIMTFDKPIQNGPGFDFAVFENSFLDDFLELAIVQVSSNGIDYISFPSVSLTQTTEQIGSFGSLDATKIHNLAGKYRGMYGVPFNLDDIDPVDNFDDFNVTHVKVISISGCIDETYANYDSEGNIINDPWPTMFPSGGFDLDAVGVINNTSNGTSLNKIENLVRIFPNPVERDLNLQLNLNENPISYSILNICGETIVQGDLNNVKSSPINLELIQASIYFLRINFENFQITQKFIKK